MTLHFCLSGDSSQEDVETKVCMVPSGWRFRIYINMSEVQSSYILTPKLRTIRPFNNSSLLFSDRVLLYSTACPATQCVADSSLLPIHLLSFLK